MRDLDDWPYRRREWFYWYVIHLAENWYTWADRRIQKSRGM